MNCLHGTDSEGDQHSFSILQGKLQRLEGLGPTQPVLIRLLCEGVCLTSGN